MSEFIEIDLKDKVVCVNISRTYDKDEREDEYARARHYRKVFFEKANKAKLVLATVQGIVKAAFKPYRWYLTDSTKYPGIYEFESLRAAMSQMKQTIEDLRQTIRSQEQALKEKGIETAQIRTAPALSRYWRFSLQETYSIGAFSEIQARDTSHREILGTMRPTAINGNSILINRLNEKK